MAELTGYDMDMFLRPPAAAYSERTLYVARRLGYRNIFYSMAYEDWLVDEQPGAEAALDHVMTNYHKGAIILLHAVSSSNAEALGDMITELKALGYRFGYLYEVE
jgi:peptidoglycan-N-acetylmuramic acid deacetylase